MHTQYIGKQKVAIVLIPSFLEAVAGSHTVYYSTSAIQIASTNALSLMSYPAGRPATKHTVTTCERCNKNYPKYYGRTCFNVSKAVSIMLGTMLSAGNTTGTV